MYEQKMIQAMSILVDNAISKLKFDKSIQAEIFQVVNPELAEYKVKYAGNIFTAYSNDLNYKYKVGDAVWVKVPEGDFSNKKFIENKVSARSVPTGVVEDQIFNLTPPVAEFTPEKDSAGVRSRYAERDTWTASAEDLQNRLLLNKDFAVYSKGYKNFQIKASFTTKFKEPLPAKGNYGIKVTFTTEKPEVSPSFVLDRTFFLGDYYNNALDVEQSGEFSVAEDVVLTGIKSIELFAEGFDVTGEDYKDIFLNSFTMTYIDIVDLNNVPYYLKLSTPEGFSGNTIKAKAQLFIQGELQKDDDYEIQWYEQDYSVTSSSDKYNRDGGHGWALIDGATGKEFTLERKRYTNSYKAIAYFDNNKASANIQVVGVSPETLQLVRQENKLTVLTLDSQKPDDSLTYTWYASMPNGSYLQIQEPSNDNSVNIEPYLVYSGIIFYCEVSDSQGVYARLSSAHLSGEMVEEGISVAFIGEEFFNYDANGDIPVEDALRDRELSVSIDWGEYPEPKRFELKWVAPDGVELEPLNTLPSSANKHDCERSQIQELWVDVNNVLHYCIKQRFSLTNVDNTIGLKVIDLDNDKTFLFSKTFTFLKDGDTGTNGTTYAARIAYCDVNGVVIEGFGGLKWDIVNSWSTAYVRVLIYHNGEELTPAEYQDWNLTWQGKNVIIGDGSKETSKGSEVVSITGSGIGAADEHYIRVSAQYRGSGQSNTNLYPHFTVDVYVGDLNPQYLDATEIPSSIVYSSSGVNPKFYNKALKVKYWNPNTSDYDEFRGSDGSFTISTGELVITEQKRDNDYYLNPFESINDANGKMPVYSYTFNGFTVYHTTLLYINTYGNEAINGWDGISVEIDNEGGNIFAPQIGAGIKNADNTFTGVVMGKVGDASAGSGSSVYGLYGYNAGENTFYVTEKGDCYLKGKISSAEGEIGGWKITSNALYSTGDIARPGSASPSPTDKNIRLQSDGTFARNLLKDSQRPTNLKFAIGDKFAVDENGVLYSGGAVIKASKLEITVDNSDKDVKEYIDESASGLDTELREYFNQEAGSLQTQIDGKIETWTQENDPSLDWKDDKAKHEGDIWYSSNGTKTWNGQTWEETKSVPPDILKDVWDGKRTIFSAAPPSHPEPPYEVNDLWVQGATGQILYCLEGKQEGESYEVDDWAKADYYIDASKAGEVAQDKVNGLDNKLNDSFEIFQRLTKDYTIKGLVSDPDNNALYINADAIHTGAIMVGGTNKNDAALYADYGTGEVRIKAKHLEISAGEFSLTGDTTLADKFTNYDTEIEDVRNSVGKSQSLTMVLSNEYEGIPCSADGTPISAVNVTTSVTVFYGSSDVTSQCTYKTDVKSNIEGSFDSSSHIYTITKLTADSGYAEISATYNAPTNEQITVTRQFNVVKVKAGVNGANGQNGQDGAPARIYSLDPMDLTAFVRDPVTKVVTPDFIYYEASYRDGIDTSTHAVPRTFIIERYDSADGSAFSLTSTHPVGTMESWGGSEGTTLEGKALRFVLKESQGSPNILDVKTVPIIDNGKNGKDGTSLTDKEIFDKVTDYGKKQGLFIDSSTGDGKVYINASYIRSGTLILGGLNNQYGQLEIRDSKDLKIGEMNNIGIFIQTSDNLRKSGIEPEGFRLFYGTLGKHKDDQLLVSPENTAVVVTAHSLRFLNNIIEYTTSDNSSSGYHYQITSEFTELGYDKEISGDSSDFEVTHYRANHQAHLFEVMSQKSLGKAVALICDTDYSAERLHKLFSAFGEKGMINNSEVVAGKFLTYTYTQAVSTSSLETSIPVKTFNLSPTISTGSNYIDNGSGQCDENGECIIYLEDNFIDTCDTSCIYQVFLTQIGNKKVEGVIEKASLYFKVKGEPYSNFDWLILSSTRDNATERFAQDKITESDILSVLGNKNE